jgi:hypothetical protein
MNIFDSPLVLAALLAVGIVVGLIMRYFIFRASCALVDVDPPPSKSILIVLFGLAIALGIGVPMFGLPFGLLPGWQIPFNAVEQASLYIGWCILGLAIIWAILGAIYIPAVPVPVAKAFKLSAWETAMGVLANALLLALILIIAAAFQIVNKTGPNKAPNATSAPPPPAAVDRAS